MGYGREYFRHTVATTISAVGVGALFYLLRILLYHHLTPEEYGLFYGVMAAGALAGPLLTFGFDPGIVPHITRLRERDDPSGISRLVLTCLLPQAALGALLVAAVFIGAEPIAAWRLPGGAWVLRIVALHALVFVIYRAALAILLGMQFIAARAFSEFAYTLGCLIIALVLLRRGFGVNAPAIAYLGAAGIGTLTALAFGVLLRPGLLRIAGPLRFEEAAEVFRSGKHLSIALGGFLVFSQVDTVMLMLLDDDLNAVAAYQLAVPTLMIPYGLAIAGARSFIPMATTLWTRNEKERLADGIARLYEVIAVVLLPATLVMACFSDILIATLFRRDIMDAPAAFSILASGGAFYFCGYFNLQVLAGIGRTRGAARAVAMALAANLFLNAFLIPWLGLCGAAYATVISYAAASALTLREIHRDLEVPLRSGAILAAALACIPMALIGYGVRRTMLFLEYPLAVSIVAGLAMLLGCFFTLESTGASRLRLLAKSILAREHSQPHSN